MLFRVFEKRDSDYVGLIFYHNFGAGIALIYFRPHLMLCMESNNTPGR